MSSHQHQQKNNQYKNLVFTDHALNRAQKRVLTKEKIFQTVESNDNKIRISNDKFKFIKTIDEREIQVIAKQIKNHQWLVISVWVRGEDDPVPIIWQILILPFKLIWKLIMALIKLI